MLTIFKGIGIGILLTPILIGLSYGVFAAIDKEAAFNSRIHASRCATGKYPAGYCKSYNVADARGGK